ncbi:response regulator transcription factor [Nocardioides rubriscoriae]|uniref:response regulator transcription factor n=1 Tax=Nocardioides rubriscoriae TaxID=642762 RepID=UPI0011E05A28|nr:response regulator transcription factor [Nocardioides rubriscoriae]
MRDRAARPHRSDTSLRSLRDARVLVVDDEPAIADLLHRTLRVAGFATRTAASCGAAMASAAECPPELAILDVMLPDGTGFDLCHQLRETHPALAVVFLTARDALEDRLTGLNLGGDDYITKPFSVAEVVARVNAVLRRSGAGAASSVLRVGDLELDDDSHEVQRAGQPVDLSPTEFKLLRFLLENAGRVLSKQQILAQVWQYDFAGDPAVVEKFVSQLRRKIDDGHPQLLHTVRGFGYVLRVSP